MTIPLVARRARVSLRTVYRHFPTREALFDAWAEWVDESLQIHLHSYPEQADRLPEFALELYRSYDESEPLVKAMLNSKAARAVRERTRRRRQRAFERAMSELTDGLEPKERLRALGGRLPARERACLAGDARPVGARRRRGGQGRRLGRACADGRASPEPGEHQRSEG